MPLQVRLGRIDSSCLSHAGFSTAEVSQLNKLDEMFGFIDRMADECVSDVLARA
jgi:hypothetical protein